jgi:ectoine hydroxylase-related dioxygenase (phytanoyl-CoA dioxygenase family)
LIPSNLLSQREIDGYLQHGYLVPNQRLSETDVETLQRLSVQLVASNPRAPEAIRSPHLVAGTASDRRTIEADWFHIASDPNLLDIVEQLIGPDIILWTSTLFYKPPLGAATPWHRDGCPFVDLKNTESAVTAWIAVFDVMRENGALRVIPKSHTSGSVIIGTENERHIAGPVHPCKSDESTAVDLELRAGEMIIFDVSTVHGSLPNYSSCSRYAYAARFLPAARAFDRSSVAGLARSRELILVRGRDVAGNIFA